MKTRWLRISALVLFALGALFLFGTKVAIAGNSCISNVASGNWNTASSWNNCGGLVPQSGDDATISSGNTITVDVDTASLNSLTVDGTLTVGNSTTVRTVTVAGSITLSGIIAPNNPGSSTSHSLLVSGNFTNNGTFTSTNGSGRLNVTLNGTTQTIAGSSTTAFSTITIATGSTVTGSTASTASTANINNGGKYIQTAGTAILGSSTKNFVSGSTYELQTALGGSGFSGSTYGNLIINFTGSTSLQLAGVLTTVANDLTVKNTGTATLRFASSQSPTVNISGNLIIEGGTVEASSTTGVPIINVSGNMQQSGGTLRLSTSSTGGQALNVTGSVLLSAGTFQPMTSSGIPTISVKGDWTNSGGTFTSGSTTVTFNSTTAAQAIGGSSTTSFNNLTIANTSATVSANTNLNVSATMTVNSSAVFNPAATIVINSGGVAGTLSGAGTIKVTRTAATADYSNQYKFSTNTLSSMTVDYAGSGAQTINSIVEPYGALTTSGSNTKTLDGAINVNGSVTLGSGTTLDVTGANYGLLVSGNWINNGGTFTSRGGTVYFSGASAQAINGTAATPFNSLTLNNSSGMTMTADATVAAGLTLTSGKIDTGSSTLTLDCDASVSGASSSKYILGNLKKNFCATGSFSYPAGTANGYSPVDVTLTALGTSPSSLQIKAVQSNATGLTDSKALDRYWTLTETNDLTANLTFTYLDGDVDGTESDYRVYRGTTDMCGTPCVDTTNNKVTVNGISTFSNWSAGEASAPTAADLVAFRAEFTRAQRVRLEWETGTELNIVGFNVYRAGKKNGAYKKLNGEMIVAKNVGNVQGAAYVFKDFNVKHNRTYFYKIEIVKANGTSEWSNAIKVKVE